MVWTTEVDDTYIIITPMIALVARVCIKLTEASLFNKINDVVLD